MGLKVYPGEIQSFASDISSNVESLGEVWKKPWLKLKISKPRRTWMEWHGAGQRSSWQAINTLSRESSLPAI